MDAGIIDDMELSLYVEDGQRLAVDLGHHAMPRFHIIGAGNPYELCHDTCDSFLVTDS